MVLRDNLLNILLSRYTPTSPKFQSRNYIKVLQNFLHSISKLVQLKLAQRFASVNLEVPSRRYDKVNKYLSAIEIFVLKKMTEDLREKALARHQQ
jgi:hypothetical protein